MDPYDFQVCAKTIKMQVLMTSLASKRRWNHQEVVGLLAQQMRIDSPLENGKKNCETYPNSRRGSQDLNIMIRSMTPPLRRKQDISSCLSGPPSLGYPRPVISLKTINTWVWSYRVRITWRIEKNKAERAERTPIHSILLPELIYSTQGAFDDDNPFFPRWDMLVPRRVFHV